MNKIGLSNVEQLYTQNPFTSSLFSLLILLGLIALYVFIIMIIWNHVLIKKFPQQKIEKLAFVDALALSVFVSLLSHY